MSDQINSHKPYISWACSRVSTYGDIGLIVLNWYVLYRTKPISDRLLQHFCLWLLKHSAILCRKHPAPHTPQFPPRERVTIGANIGRFRSAHRAALASTYSLFIPQLCLHRQESHSKPSRDQLKRWQYKYNADRSAGCVGLKKNQQLHFKLFDAAIHHG
jgi:hypothetical protein